MKKIRHFLSRLLWSLLSLCLTLVMLLAVVYFYFSLQLPNVKALKDVHMQVPLRIYSADDKLIAQYGAKRRIPVTLKQIPQPLIHALLATEDARYYEHAGVDLIGIARAAIAVVTSGRKVQGASTITMQVARNFFLTRHKTYSRKIKEILLALKIDQKFSKDKVLELYLNKIYFGNRAYGVAAAAQVYYGKKLNQLTLPQMAMLAGLPQAPSRNNPLDNPQGALQRRNHVLARMLAVGYINKATYQAAIAAPVTAKYHRLTMQVQAPYVAEMVREAMVDEYGKSAYERGLSVYTTINSHLQQAANQAVHDGLLAYDLRHGYRAPTMNLGVYDRTQWLHALQMARPIDDLYPAAVLSLTDHAVKALLASGDVIMIPWSGLSWARPQLKDGYVGRKPQTAAEIVKPGDLIYVTPQAGQWRLTQIPQVQGALISLNPQNGAIVALSGGFDYQRSNFNRAIQAERQPGSGFKPFIYSAALNQGYTLASIINDAPIVKQDTGENALWRPMNDTRRFYGPTSLRVGLTKSRNLVSIRLLASIGIPYTLNYISRFGFDPNTLPHTLSLALGSGTVTPLQLATGYAVFANGGFQVEPYFIQRITGRNHNVLFKAQPSQACEACLQDSSKSNNALISQQPLAKRVISAQNAYIMTQVLRDVIRYGTGRQALILKRSDLAGKTGTTNKFTDAWFSGFNSHIVTSVWVGFDNLRSLHEYGSQAALPIWIQFMRVALTGTAEATMPQPAGIVTARIDPSTGLLALPDQQNAMFEVFRKRYMPTQYSSTPTLPASQPNADDESVATHHIF